MIIRVGAGRGCFVFLLEVGDETELNKHSPDSQENMS